MKVRKSKLYIKLVEQNPGVIYKLYTQDFVEASIDGEKVLVKAKIVPKSNKE